MRYLYKGNIFTDRNIVIKLANKLGGTEVPLLLEYTKYDSFPWFLEPNKSLDELYKNQAARIRETYDYIILMYSGGADSHQVLCSFLDNGIHLDEVWSFYPLKMINKAKSLDLNATELIREYEEAVVPRFRRYPNTKFRVWDISQYIEENYQNENFIVDNATPLTYSLLYWALLRQFHSRTLSDYIENIPGKTAVLFGHDKPSLMRVDNKLYHGYSEFHTEENLARCDPSKLNHKIIRFFLDDPRITSKQSHIILKAINATPQLKRAFSTILYHQYLKDSPFIKTLIYPSTYEPNIFQQRKKLFNDDDIFEAFFGLDGRGVIEDINNNILKKSPNIGIVRPNGQNVLGTMPYYIGDID